MEAILARGEGFGALDPWLARLEQEGGERPLGEGVADGRRLATWIAALLLRRPGAELLGRITREGYRRLLTPLEPEVRGRLGGVLLLHGLLDGGSGRVALVAGALRGGVERGAGPTAQIAAYLGDAVHDWGRGRSRAALAAVRAGLAVSEREGLAGWGRWLRRVGVAVALGRGEVATADGWLREGLFGESPASTLDLALYHLLLAWRGMAAGEAGTTVEAAEVAEAMAEEVGVAWLVWAARLLRGQALVLHGKVDEGRSLVTEVRPLAERLGGPWVTVSTSLTEAHLAAEAGDKAERRAALTRGLAEARSRGQRLWLGQRRSVATDLMATAICDGVEGEEARGWVRGWELPPPPPPRRVAAWPWPVRIETLGRFRVVRDGVAVTLVSAGQRRPLDLLRALLACGGHAVRRERLADLLWPEADGDASQRVFATTLHRLRRLLGDGALVAPRDGTVGLDPSRVWVDAWVAEEGLEPLLTRGRRRGGLCDRRQVEAAEGAIDLYRGVFLRATGGESWLLAPRERLHGRVVRAVERVGGFWEGEGELARAIATYERGLEVDELEESFYQGVIRSWLALDRRSKAVVAYRRCEVALGEGLGVEPSRETEALLRPSTPPLPRKRLYLPRDRR